MFARARVRGYVRIVHRMYRFLRSIVRPVSSGIPYGFVVAERRSVGPIRYRAERVDPAPRRFPVERRVEHVFSSL